jgi:hypothetical protein
VFIPDDDRVVSIAIEHLEPVQPNKGDRVREFCTCCSALSYILIDILPVIYWAVK